MFDLFFCIRDQHDFRLVLLAALVCAISSGTAILMIRQAASTRTETARLWLLAGGLATGFGIWSTHFIAMLGYDPGVIAGYRPVLTAASLGIVLVTTIQAFRMAASRPSAAVLAVSAALAGCGFAAMHYLGMAALVMPARIQWTMGYVLVSLVFAVVPLNFALTMAIRRRGAGSAALAAGLMVVAIVGLHFCGMTAIRLVPDRMQAGGILLSPKSMSVVIGTVSLLLLGLCLAGWAIARRTNAAIAASRQQFSILVHGISDCAIYMLDQDGRIATWNAGAQRLKGYTADEVVGQTLALFYTSEDRVAGLHSEAIAHARLHGKYTGEGWRVRRDGSRFWAHVTIEQVLDDDGQFVGYAKITRDMTQFKQDQDQIEQARSQLDAALEHMHQGLCLFDANDRLVLRNRRFAELWNLPPESCPPGMGALDVARTALAARTGAAVSDGRLDALRRVLLDSLVEKQLAPIMANTGETFWVEISSRTMPGGGWVTTCEDVTAAQQSRERAAHLAQHDMLTGLPNRASFHRWLGREIEAVANRGQRLALVSIGLDRFKEINEAHGYAMGDAVLQKLAQALAGMTGDGEIAARLGGDEFAIAAQFADPEDLSGLLARITAVISSLGEAAKADGGLPPISASMGVAVFPDDAASPEVLLGNADLARSRAKSSLTESICFYEVGMDEQARRRRQLGHDLRQAVARNELTVLYQEQRSVRDGMLCGYEALLRWTHPVHGPIPPDEFIPIAEETGEIVGLGEWVLRTACMEAARWIAGTKVAVNLSPVQLLKADLPELVAQVLVQTGLSPKRLELEITESAIITDKLRALHSLRRIKALGVSVAMDDFGTGYSSLDTLHSFPFDKIKIDKSFLLQAEASEQARAIVRAVVALGRTLGIPVLAEGVERESHLDLLFKEGCEEAQGYYFGRPMAAPSTVALPALKLASG